MVKNETRDLYIRANALKTRLRNHYFWASRAQNQPNKEEAVRFGTEEGGRNHENIRT
jgi:hypothetical protein